METQETKKCQREQGRWWRTVRTHRVAYRNKTWEKKREKKEMMKMCFQYGQLRLCMILDACAAPARGLSPTTCANTLKELSLEREILGWLIEARSGHGHFAAYHRRFGHEQETDHYCRCGRRRAQLHPFSCPNARAYRSDLWYKKTRRQLGPEEIHIRNPWRSIHRHWLVYKAELMRIQAQPKGVKGRNPFLYT